MITKETYYEFSDLELKEQIKEYLELLPYKKVEQSIKIMNSNIHSEYEINIVLDLLAKRPYEEVNSYFSRMKDGIVETQLKDDDDLPF